MPILFAAISALEKSLWKKYTRYGQPEFVQCGAVCGPTQTASNWTLKQQLHIEKEGL
jgi:hypothetical protein